MNDLNETIEEARQMKEEDKTFEWYNSCTTEKTLVGFDIVYQHIEQVRNLLGENENEAVDILGETLDLLDKITDEERGKEMMMKGYEDSEYFMSQQLHHVGTISKTIAFALSSIKWYDNPIVYNVWFSEVKEKRQGKKIKTHTVQRTDMNKWFNYKSSAEAYIKQVKKDPAQKDLH